MATCFFMGPTNKKGRNPVGGRGDGEVMKVHGSEHISTLT